MAQDEPPIQGDGAARDRRMMDFILQLFMLALVVLIFLALTEQQ